MGIITLMTGSEAIVQGAIESGVRIVSGYPGYPITGIVENAQKAGLEDMHVEWAPNEKVALETVLGASIAGYRGLAVMKQVGMNVAADPLMATMTWGIRGGVVIVAGDDHGCEGSPVEQDSRCYGPIAHIPVLEPSTPEEGRQMVRAAFAASEKFGLPIILRFVREYGVMKGEIEKGDISQGRELASRDRLATFCGIWTEPVLGHYLRHEKMESILADLSRFNSQEGKGTLGIVTSGYVANLIDAALKQINAKEKVSILKLGVIPTPDRTLEAFLKGVSQVFLAEVGEPLIEEQVRRLAAIPVFGKMSGHMVYAGDIQIDDLVKVLANFIKGMPLGRPVSLVPAFRKVVGHPLFGDMKGKPVMCPGCPGIGLHYSLKKAKEKHDLLVFCDHGCVSFGGLAPYHTLDGAICMGATPGAAHGACLSGKKGVALIGDSAFMHSGIGGLMNMVNNHSSATIIIFDNLSTAMTGRQPNPATGVTIRGQKTKRIRMEDVCRACGLEDVTIVDPYDLKECQKTIERAVQSEGGSVLIARRECALIPGINYGRVQVDRKKCDLCMDCVEAIQCPAISLKEKIVIDEKCIGCMICAQICPQGAIFRETGTGPSKGKGSTVHRS